MIPVEGEEIIDGTVVVEDDADEAPPTYTTYQMCGGSGSEIDSNEDLTVDVNEAGWTRATEAMVLLPRFCLRVMCAIRGKSHVAIHIILRVDDV